MPNNNSVHAMLLHQKIFGRDELIRDILKLLGSGVSVVIHGEENSGKSTVMKALLKALCNKPIGRVVFLPSVRSEKIMMQEIAFQLCAGIDEGKIFSNNTSTTQLEAFVRAEFRNSPYKIFILVDDINSSLPSKTIEALGALLSLGGIMLTTTRSLNTNKALMAKLKPVEVTGLSEEDAFQMIEELTAEKSVEDISFLKKALYEKTRGFPGWIKKAVDSFGEEMITRKLVEDLSIQTSEKIRYMFVSITTVLIASLMVNKYMSRVATLLGGRIDYVLGAIGLVLAMTIRFVIHPYLKREK